MLKCPNKDCANALSADDNNFRGSALPDGGETLSCKLCGTEAHREETKPDAILPKAPTRPLKTGDAANLPIKPFDTSEEKTRK